ncbi:MAG TPA: hypothetical protein VFW90_02970 [Candidatus Saccharimonadales bacterium]|nr:hypothetical protein [Candidatus Saccharimonadales bacterium]
MDSLGEILGTKDFSPPDEVTIVKDYITRHYKSGCRVKLEHGVLSVAVPSNALAATIQLERDQLIKACGLKARLSIRTGR